MTEYTHKGVKIELMRIDHTFISYFSHWHNDDALIGYDFAGASKREALQMAYHKIDELENES